MNPVAFAPAPADIIDRPDRPTSIVAPKRKSLKKNRRRRSTSDLMPTLARSASVTNDRAARLAAIPAGESPANRRSPVTVVAILSDGEGDRPVESLRVKVPEGWEFQSDGQYRGASSLRL